MSGGVVTRAANSKRVRELTAAQALPVVTVTEPQRAGTSYALELPGRLEAYSRAPIYARVSGYLQSWHVDIGSPVQAGQLLAEIEAPDLDQQLSQAKADLLTAQAVYVAGTEAAGFLIERVEGKFSLRPIAHIRPDNSDQATRTAELVAGPEGAYNTYSKQAVRQTFCHRQKARAG